MLLLAYEKKDPTLLYKGWYADVELKRCGLVSNTHDIGAHPLYEKVGTWLMEAQATL